MCKRNTLGVLIVNNLDYWKHQQKSYR